MAKEKLNEDVGKGIDVSVDFCGHKLQSPFILSSGPLCADSEGMIRGHNAGAGAVVTKTIRLGRAINPVEHIGKIGRDSLMNAEKWADTDRQLWYEKEIPEARAAGAIVIGSVGHTLTEARAIVEDVERAGAHMIELVSYTEDTLLPMLDFAKEHVAIPVICKLSGNWPDTVGTATKCLEHGADGICAIDSIGPTLKIDIHNARPAMRSADGYGWLTGASIRPIVMRIISEIARNHPDFDNLYSSGGMMKAEDAVEFMMAGARAVGVCSLGILKGVEVVSKLITDLKKLVVELGYSSLDEVWRAALPNFPTKEHISRLDFTFKAYKDDGIKKECINCMFCVDACSYNARQLNFPHMFLNTELCRDCGLCVDVCPTDALTATLAPQTEEDLLRAKESAEYEDRMSKVE